MNLTYLLRRLNANVERIKEAKPGMKMEQVYEKAIVITFMTLSEYDLKPLHERILIAIDRMAPWNNSLPVTCPSVQMRFEQTEEPVKHWTLWSHASDLEKWGLIHRPSGRNGGYKLTEEGRDYLRDRGMDIKNDAKMLLRDEDFIRRYIERAAS